MAKQTFDLSFHCAYPNGDMTRHYQTMELKEIPKWLEVYRFTHPQCISITVKVWFHEEQ